MVYNKKTRVLLVRRRCPFCLEWKKMIHWVNLKLPIENRIEVKDCFEWEEFGIVSHPVMEKFDREDFDGYPFCYIDGITIGPAQTEQLLHVLKGILSKEAITPII